MVGGSEGRRLGAPALWASVEIILLMEKEHLHFLTKDLGGEVGTRRWAGFGVGLWWNQ